MFESIQLPTLAQPLTFIVIAYLLYRLHRYLRGTSYKIPSVDLSGKRAIITGGAQGLGKQTVKELVKLKCQVIIADKNKEQALNCIKQIKKEWPAAEIEFEYLDLASLKSIQDFAEKVSIHSLDYLINNAGVYNMRKERKTVQNFQMDFGVNYIGHFYLTHLLWPILNKGPTFKVINLASVTHKKKHLTLWGQPVLEFDDLNLVKSYSPNEAYARSKLCIVMGTKYLGDEMGQSHKGRVVSVHPGIVRTGIMDQVFTFGLTGKIVQVLWWTIYPLYAFMTKNVTQGNQTTMSCLLQNIQNGAYYAQCTKEEMSPFVNEQNCKKLWLQTERLLNIKFRFNQTQ